jgi:hypothetical protein
MSNGNDEPNSDPDSRPGMEERISFRDYPSTGLVVLAALVSGLGWLIYKWSGEKRAGQSTASGKPQPTKGSEPQ